MPEGTPPADIPVNERIITISEDETEVGWRSDFSAQNRWGTANAGVRLTQTDVDFNTVLREDWISLRLPPAPTLAPPGQDFIVLTPDNVNSEYQAKEVSYAAYGEQVFEFDRWDLRAGLRYDYDGFAEQSLVSPRLAGPIFACPPGLSRVPPPPASSTSRRYFWDRAANADNFRGSRMNASRISAWASNGILANSGTCSSSPITSSLTTSSRRPAARTVGSPMTVTARPSAWTLSCHAILPMAGLRTLPTPITKYASTTTTALANTTPTSADRTSFRWAVPGKLMIAWKIGARWKYASGRPVDDFVINEDVLPAGQPLRFSKELTRQNALRLDDYHSP